MPQSHYHALEATGHCPHLTHPDETIQAIRSFLASSVEERTLSAAG
jgi:sigma-B regulation protein RsbQ